MLNLKTTHKVIQTYYSELQKLRTAGQIHEGAVAPLFANILRYGAGQVAHLDFVEQYPLKREGKPSLRADGALVDRHTQILVYGVWEAKDIQDNLPKEVAKKFQEGYPKDNILFQTPSRVLLYQHGELAYEADTSHSPEKLIHALELFFAYQPPAYQQWEEAISKFRERVSELGTALVEILKKESQINQSFKEAFEAFSKLCRRSINPNLADAAILEMLVQYLLTERLFRTVFHNPDFRDKNVIAKEIEKVIAQLTAKSFSRDAFLKSLDHFYLAIERTAATIEEYQRKQEFLNVVYEKFFQGFAVKVADTYGIVYTPQPIVEFMVHSVEEILQQEFNRSLSSHGVHILDPFVGTGNFIMRVLREIDPLQLERKYREELHCNEVMLLPYYIACMNIEQAFYEQTHKYVPFEGICLVDTFELIEEGQRSLEIFVPENTARVERQRKADIMVILGNPPYNAGQQNENDNNKNRKYPTLEKRIAETYAKDSHATNKNALSDAYVKAFQWATWRLRESEEGIVAFVSNNSFLDSIAFDGMRKHLATQFTKIYHLNLKGNARTSGERRRQEAGNIFNDQIRVGVGITFLVKQSKSDDQPAEIWIYSIADYLGVKEKQEFLKKAKSFRQVPFQLVKMDKNHTWLTEGLRADFGKLTPLGTKEGKADKNGTTGVVFKLYGGGIKTNRDAWAYNFTRETLANNMQRTIEVYNEQVYKWSRRGNPQMNLDDFVLYDDTKLSWDSTLKRHLQNGKEAVFSADKIRASLYRPFCKSHLFFDRTMNNSVHLFYKFMPTVATENRVICVSGVGSSKPFQTLMVDLIPCLDLLEKTQCFPFYTYTEDGSCRQENITDWALQTFRTHYQSHKLTKWDIFYYVYALLHHSGYRETYRANLKRELPRIPYASDFWAFAKAGQQLAELHLHYETQPEYPLQSTTKTPLNWRVDKMKLAQDKTTLTYNESLTLTGIPPEAFDYRLGNRCALEWVIDQYQVSQHQRNGIVNDPNRLEDEKYIMRLIGRVITVSVKTVEIVKGLPGIE